MPLQLQNMLFSCFKSCPESIDKTSRETARSLNRSGDPSVNKEYKNAFTSVSYKDTYSKVQGYLVGTGDSTTSSSSGLMDLLEPQQEIISIMMESGYLHPFLVDFFEATLKACRECEVVLQSIRKTRANYRKIQKAIKIAKRMTVGRKADGPSLLIHERLVEFAKPENPLRAFSATQFYDIHDHYKILLQKLTSKLKKVKRRMKFVSLFKKVGKWGLVVSCAVISVAIVIGAIHSTAGIVSVPVVAACTLVLLLGGIKNTTRKSKRTDPLDRLSAQVDRAAKGIFVLISYYKTMNSLMRTLQNEVDDIKATADICTANMNNELLKVVINKLEINDSNFMERVQELEEHVCLCFLDINRSRRSIMQVTMNF